MSRQTTVSAAPSNAPKTIAFQWHGFCIQSWMQD